MSQPVISPYTFADLRAPKDLATNKQALYNGLVANGFTQALSWEDGSAPSALVEIESDGLCDLQQGTKQILDSGFNEWAVGDALAAVSDQVYGNEKRNGQQLIGVLTLTDHGAGPFTFDPTSVSVSVGQGGLTYDGIPDPTGATTGNITVPLNGSATMYIQATAVGSAYNVAAGTINTFARGSMPGVTVTNASDWLDRAGTQAGADVESDDSLKARNRSQWGTLGVGSPSSAYESMVRDADVTITRVSVFSNIDLLDPGTVTVVIAGDAGAVPPATILAAQNAVAPAQVGGVNIPETARAVVISAANNTIPVNAILYIQSEYNTTAFQQQIIANVVAFQKSLKIGSKVSWIRLQEAITEIAGLSGDVIPDVQWNSPTADIQQLYYQVAVFDLTNLVFQSV